MDIIAVDKETIISNTKTLPDTMLPGLATKSYFYNQAEGESYARY